MKAYGITNSDYEVLLQKQNGVCAICGNKNKAGKRLVVDHDHKSGVVRGLLCNTCNIGIGNLRDDPSILQKALAYLRGDSL